LCANSTRSSPYAGDLPLIAQPAEEGFGERVLLRLPRGGVVYSEQARRGAQEYLDTFLNDFSFEDRFAIRNAWAVMLEGACEQ
jgi:hypothetical protein